MWFWANKQLAQAHFQKWGILDSWAFDRVNWEALHKALHRVPQMCQVWASKQICNITVTNRYRAKFTKNLSPKCPSCLVEDKTCAHVLFCSELGQIDNLKCSISLLDTWLRESHTEPDLAFCMLEYAQSRGGASMYEMAQGLNPLVATYAKHQNMIGWGRFMEGMVASERSVVMR